jgi:hypothetical protein
VAQTQIEVSEVSLEVVESVWKDHPERGTGKIGPGSIAGNKIWALDGSNWYFLNCLFPPNWWFEHPHPFHGGNRRVPFYSRRPRFAAGHSQ